MTSSLNRRRWHLASLFSWQNLKASRYRQAGFWAVFVLLWWFVGNPFIAAVVSIALVAGAVYLHARYARGLNTRVESTDTIAWDVAINQVKVGSIFDRDYALIQRRVATDVHVHVAQALNILRVAVNSCDYCLRAVPIGLFWVGAALAVFSPETLGTVLSAIHGASEEAIRQATRSAVALLIFSTGLSVAFHWTFGLSRFGFINRFDEATGTAVRKHCGVAAEGSIVLSRVVDGYHVFGDELA